jgi:hypothetical protein
VYNNVNDSLAAAHNEVWRRFVRKGIVLDYVGLDGQVVIPTAEECEKSMPNGLGWWTPIENGAFFTGEYMAALCNQYKIAPSEQLKEEIGKLANGLFTLQDAAKTDGLIIRGVADDGVSHYPCGSDDQVGPWMYGMWKCYQSSILSPELREEVKARMMRVITALERHHWKLPTEWEGVYNGDYMKNFTVCAARVLCTCRIAYELTHDEYWLDQYKKFLYEKPENGYLTRLEMCRNGFAIDLADGRYPRQFWILAVGQYHLHVLCELETDKTLIEAYKAGLSSNGVVAMTSIEKYKEYDNANDAKFDVDWRPMNKLWREHATADEAREISLPQSELWAKEIAPRRQMEHTILVDAINANWIAQLSMNKEIIEQSGKVLHELMLYLDWRKLYLPCAFYAECAWYEYMMVP